ncbi:Uncharacterised protein [Vibrio cholerae]|nr:Uncharacterised protein [Vibrio cholerae]
MGYRLSYSAPALNAPLRFQWLESGSESGTCCVHCASK